MFARQRAIIEGRINDGALFPNILISITEQMRRIGEQARNNLREATTKAVEQIRDDLKVMLAASPPRDTRSSESRGRLIELAEVVRVLKEDTCMVGDTLQSHG